MNKKKTFWANGPKKTNTGEELKDTRIYEVPPSCSVLSLYLAGFLLSFCPLVLPPSCCLVPSRIVSAVVSAVAAVAPLPAHFCQYF